MVTSVSGWSLSLIFNSLAVQEECQEQVDALLYGGLHGWWLTLNESNGANHVLGVSSFLFYFFFFCLYSGNSPSCASFQLFPHVVVATSSSSNLFISLCPDDSPSLVHFFPHGQATHLLPPVFHFFIFPFHLASRLTAPLSFIHFPTFTLLHSFYHPTSQWEIHTPVTWPAPLFSLRTNHHTCHPLYNNASICSWQSSWTAWHMKMGLIGHSKSLVTNCQPMPYNIPEEKRPPLHHGGSLNSGMVTENFFHYLQNPLIPTILPSDAMYQ